MSKHEQHAGHPATAEGKAGDCCGGTHGHEEMGVKEQDKKPSAESLGPHTHAPRAAHGSCGCGGKHK